MTDWGGEGTRAYLLKSKPIPIEVYIGWLLVLLHLCYDRGGGRDQRLTCSLVDWLTNDYSYMG